MKVNPYQLGLSKFGHIGNIHSMSTTPEHTNARLAVAEEVLSLMGRRRVSQTKLAEELSRRGCPMSQPSLSKRLSGLVPFDTDELLAVAAYFDVEVTKLFVGLTQGGSPLPWTTTPTESDETDILVTECDGQLDLLAA